MSRDLWILAAQFRVFDSSGSGQTIEIEHHFIFYPHKFRDWRDYSEWVLHCVLEAEEHEAREWFRIDGLLFDDPHAGDRLKHESL